jgi:glucan phosphoethanolaminetransferase (alkaline phosphatase superfamily)
LFIFLLYFSWFVFPFCRHKWKATSLSLAASCVTYYSSHKVNFANL